MSFRSKLTLFFLAIVVLPMVSVALVLFRLISDSEEGKADARIAAHQEDAIGLYYQARDEAGVVADRIGKDRLLSTALHAGDRVGIQQRAEHLRRRYGATRVTLDFNGKVLADEGARFALFPATRELQTSGSRPLARLQVGVIDAQGYARLVRRVTRLDTVIRRSDNEVMAATLDGSGRIAIPPRPSDVTINGSRYRIASFPSPGFRGTRTRVAVLQSKEQVSTDTRDSRLLAGGLLLAFFILAVSFAFLVSRSLQRQVAEFLQAARRLGSGDFSAAVPTAGRDEFAALGEEFNKMSQQLEARVEELRQERMRLELSLRRIGETFASNLDRDALLDIVVHTAVDGVNADGGRATARREDGKLVTVARAGKVGEMRKVVQEAEKQALANGGPADVSENGGSALAHPLRAAQAEESGPARVVGMISAWRAESPFSDSEREIFHYLAGQAAVSVENVGLHETVERQAVTDELTGLSNRRRFQETLGVEVERSKRFGQHLGLVMLDIDDFKKVNDTYGHQQGDLVLREVARILRETSREIDEPARYGGEELAVVLPGTDLEGAFNLAERVREGIAALELPILGDGGVLRVTASFGAAALPDSAGDQRSLVAAADEALYEAKRGGKNRTVRAG